MPHKKIDTVRVCEQMADMLNDAGRQARLSTQRTGDVDTPQWEKYVCMKSFAGKLARKLGFPKNLRQRGDTVFCTRTGEGQQKAYERGYERQSRRRKRK